jgi:hypothetical protein
MMRSVMARRSIAMDNARRTRTSCSGLRPSGLAVVVRHEGAVLVLGAQVVEAEEDQPQPDRLAEMQPLVLAQPREVGGRHLVDEVEVAGQQRRGARGVVGDHAVVHALEGGRLAPVGRVALELDAVAAAVGDGRGRARCRWQAGRS